MLKNIIFAMLSLALCFNVAQVACPLVAQEARATKAVTPQAVPATPKSVDRVSLRVDNQIKRLTKDLELSEQQVEDTRKLYTEYENKQAELRKQLTDLNKERQTKFESLLTDEQKQKISDKKGNLGKLREQNQLKMKSAAEEAASPRLKAATPTTEQSAKPVMPATEQKK